MAILYKNNAASTLASGIASGATSLTVATGHGARFPTVSGSDYFYVTIISASDPTVFEIVKCTGRSGDVLTIVRAQESTTAAAWSANDRVEQRITAAMLSDALGERLALTGGTLTGASTVSVSTWEKWTLETTGVTAKARQGSDTNGLNFTSNARWTGSAWAEDDSTRKKFAYIQHLGNGRHEFRTSPTGAGVSWTTSLTVDETAVNSTVALTQGGNQVLHAGNYNSYSPTLTGTGASGSWGISITGSSASATGNAATATTLQTARTINGTSFNGSANITTASWGTARTLTIGATGKSVDGSGNVSWTLAEIGAPSTTDAMISRGSVATASVDTATLNGFYTQSNVGDSDGLLVFNSGGSLGPLQMYFKYSGIFQWRNKTDSTTWTAWKTVLHSANYTSYSPSLTGTGASGTWGISITGNAATATSATDSTKLPLSGGTLTGTLYFTDTTNGLSKSGGRLTVRSESTDNVANFAGYGLYLPVSGATAGLYVESPIEARSGLRIGNGAGSGTITVGADTSETASRLVQRDSSGGIFGTYIRARKNQTAGDYTTAALWTESYGNTATGVAFHISGNVGKFLEMRTNGILYWNGDTVIHSGNYSSWALPVSGGTLTGTLNVSNGNVIQFYTNNGSLRGYMNVTDTDDNHFQIATSGGEDIVFKDGGLAGTRNLVIRGANAGTEAYGSMRSPIFYDSSDTGYYCDPNSTSQFNQARFVNRIAVGNGSTPYLNTGTAGIWFSNGGGASHFAGSHDSDTSWWGVYTNGAWRSWLTGGGSWISTGDQRAPIWYDYNDTSFYLDAASTTTSLQIAGAVEQGNNFAHPNVEWSYGGSSSGMVIFKLPGGSGNYGMVHMVFDIYEYDSPRIATVIVGGHNWTGSWYNTACNVIGYTNKQVRLGFKDGQYCVVFGTSGSGWSYGTIRLRKIHNGSFYNNQMDLGGSYSVSQTTTESFSAISGDLRGLRTPSTMEVDGILYGYNSIRSNIFYDNDNTGYYTDQASTSNYNVLAVQRAYAGYDAGVTGSFSCNSWFRSSGNTGWYNATYAGGIYMIDSTWVRVYGGKQFYNDQLIRSDADMRAPVFYDQDNTAYYLNAAGTSRVATLDTDRVTYLSKGYDAVYLGGSGLYQIGYPDTNWWKITTGSTFSLLLSCGWDWDRQVGFHYTPAASGSNGGTLRIGQTSKNSTSYNHTYTYMHMNGADRFYWDWNGVFQAFGDSRAPVFYEYGNTGYYLDLAGTTAIRTVGSWRADAASWDGEFSGKIQYHASHWYFQYGSLAIFRNSGGSNVLQIDQSGNLTAQGNVTAYSDRRLKENVLTLSGASDYLARIDAKTFRWKSDGRNDIGFIAQDVEEAGLPEFVITADTYNPATGETADPIKSLDYGRMVSVLWQAVKEQQSVIAAMSAEITTLKEKLK